MLKEEKVGRDKLFIHHKYMDLLASDDHAFEPYASHEVAVHDRRAHVANAVTRLAAVRDRIAAAARGVGREPADVHLIAVTKTFGAADILPVLEAGHRLFGENRVQEAKGKWPALRARYPDVELHLIGPLQSNKAREAVELFDCIHTIDRPKIATRHRRGNGAGRQAAEAVRRGQHRRGAAEGRA